MSRGGISMAMKEQIRLLRQQGKGIKAIARALNISKNTVRRWLRIEGQDNVDDSPKPGSWQEGLDWEEISKKRQSGYSIQKLHADYAPDGVSYWSFNRHLNKICEIPAKPTIPLVHEPGKATQIDYADGIPIYDAEARKFVKTELFCGVLPFSGKCFGEFTADQKQVNFLKSQENMFHFFGGVTDYVVHDNLKSGTTKAHRYDPDRNPTYVDFANHCGFASLPARPNHPRDKAIVEATIGVIQRSFYQEVRDRRFYSLYDLNAAFSMYLKRLNAAIMKDYGVSRDERFVTEKDQLNPLPKDRYDIAEWKEPKLHPDCCVQVDRNFYSAPYTLIGQRLRVRLATKTVQIYTQDLEIVANHRRLKGRGRYSIEESHYPPAQIAAARFDILQAKKRAEQIGPKTLQYVEHQLSGDRPLQHYRRVLGVLALYKRKGVTREAMEYAAAQAMTFHRFNLKYFQQCSDSFDKNRRRSGASAPARDINEIHLHAKEGGEK